MEAAAATALSVAAAAAVPAAGRVRVARCARDRKRRSVVTKLEGGLGKPVPTLPSSSRATVAALPSSSPAAVAAGASPLRSFLPPARRLTAMLASTSTAQSSGEYPSPVSPPYPAASKDVELRRAMTASASSAAIASADVMFEDEWLAVVDKPAGVYCDALLTSFPCPVVSGSWLKEVP